MCSFYLNFKNPLKSDEGKLFAIRPEESLKIGRLEKNPEKFDEIYSIGLMDGQGKIAALINYLEA